MIGVTFHFHQRIQDENQCFVRQNKSVLDQVIPACDSENSRLRTLTIFLRSMNFFPISFSKQESNRSRLAIGPIVVGDEIPRAISKPPAVPNMVSFKCGLCRLLLEADNSLSRNRLEEFQSSMTRSGPINSPFLLILPWRLPIIILAWPFLNVLAPSNSTGITTSPFLLI